MKTKLSLSFLFIAISLSVFSQPFLPGFEMFSHKKMAYLTMEDGSLVQGTIDKITRKKDNVAELRMEVDGQEVVYKPEEVKEMYLPAHMINKMYLKGFDKQNRSVSYDMDKISEGYGFFEKSMVDYKGKIQSLFLQLVNPSTANKIKVYFDPRAKETGSTKVAGMNYGSIDKSYFIKIVGSSSTAVLLSKKEYTKGFVALYKDCPNLIEEIGKKANWKEISYHIERHSKCE